MLTKKRSALEEGSPPVGTGGASSGRSQTSPWFRTWCPRRRYPLRTHGSPSPRNPEAFSAGQRGSRTEHDPPFQRRAPPTGTRDLVAPPGRVRCNTPVPSGGPLKPLSRRRRSARIVRWLSLTLLVVIVVLNWTWGRLPEEPPPTGQFLQVGALQVHYLDQPGSGAAVLLMHGLPGTADDFAPVTPMLAGHRVIAIDRPGYGYSSGGFVPFPQQLDVIHTLLAHLGIARVIIVGHSYGGTIALGYAERYPDQTAGLVLVDAAAGGARPSTMNTVQAHLVRVQELRVVRPIANATFSQVMRKAAAEYGDRQAFAPAQIAPDHLGRLLASNMTDGDLQAYVGETLAAGSEIQRIDDGLAAVRVPTVIIQGQSDRLVAPGCAERLAAELAHATLIKLPGGHMQTYAHPDAIAHAVDSLAAR